MIVIDAIVDDTPQNSPSEISITDEIRSLKPIKTSIDEPDPVILSNHKPEKKKKKKKKKSSLTAMSGDLDLVLTEEDVNEEEATQTLLDVDKIIFSHDIFDDSDEIVSEQKKGYKKLKNGQNSFKKEFAEEITLLYSLLDETTQYAKDLEKDLKGIRGSKVRGVSKYSNDLASLILTAKQTKLNIIKEISSVKKTVADLGIKDTKNNDNKNTNNTEALASQYFKHILAHGRTDFISRMGDAPIDIDVDELTRSGYSDQEELEYNRLLEDRLSSTDNPFRSADGSKYIEYENRGVEIRVNKCIDTGEWDFVAVDRTGVRIDDYPLPTKRSAGRMKFSDDSTYATDSAGIMYKVMEYYLPDNDDYYNQTE